jgi:polyisoprenoid-binding protein YceI
MNIRNIILGLAVVAVVGLLILNAKKSHNASDLVTGDVLGTTSFSELSRGEYTARDTQTIQWSGTRKFLGSYNNQGTVDVKNAEFTVSREGVAGGLTLDMESLAVTKTMTGFGFETLTNHLTTGFFNVKNYPEAHFTITGVSQTEAGEAFAGDLTIAGETKELLVPVELFGNDDGTITLTGAVSFDRTDWGITAESNKFFSNLGEKAVDDIVTVEFTLSVDKQ